MDITRRLRKKVTFELLRWGQGLARTGDHARIERLRKVLSWLAKVTVPLRKRLKRNMRLAGVYQPQLVDAHFDRAISPAPADGCWSFIASDLRN